jgi:hypothetical protein
LWLLFYGHGYAEIQEMPYRTLMQFYALLPALQAQYRYGGPTDE